MEKTAGVIISLVMEAAIIEGQLHFGEGGGRNCENLTNTLLILFHCAIILKDNGRVWRNHAASRNCYRQP